MTTTEVTISKTVEETDEINICDECGREASDALTFEIVGDSDDEELNELERWANDAIHFCDEDCLDAFRATQPRAEGDVDSDDELVDKYRIAIDSGGLQWRDVVPRRLKSAGKRLWAPYDETSKYSIPSDLFIVALGFIPVMGIGSVMGSYLAGIHSADNTALHVAHAALVAQITSLLIVTHWDISTIVTAVSYAVVVNLVPLALFIAVVVIGRMMTTGPG